RVGDPGAGRGRPYFQLAAGKDIPGGIGDDVGGSTSEGLRHVRAGPFRGSDARGVSTRGQSTRKAAEAVMLVPETRTALDEPDTRLTTPLFGRMSPSKPHDDPRRTNATLCLGQHADGSATRVPAVPPPEPAIVMSAPVRLT